MGTRQLISQLFTALSDDLSSSSTDLLIVLGTLASIAYALYMAFWNGRLELQYRQANLAQVLSEAVPNLSAKGRDAILTGKARRL